MEAKELFSFPSDSDGKKSPCSIRDLDSVPGEGNGYSSILAWRVPRTEEPGGLYIVHGVAKYVLLRSARILEFHCSFLQQWKADRFPHLSHSNAVLLDSENFHEEMVYVIPNLKLEIGVMSCENVLYQVFFNIDALYVIWSSLFSFCSFLKLVGMCIYIFMCVFTVYTYI